MAFNLLAFAGGAAGAIEEKMDTAEKEAKTFAMASTKNMHDKYMKRIEEDKVLVSETAQDMELIKSNYASMSGGKTFTADQLEQISRSPANRKYLVDSINKGKINFGNLDPEQMVKLVANNASPNVARDRIGQALTLDSTLKDTLTKQATTKQMGFFDQIGESAGKAAAQKTAIALGTTVEEMQAKLAETRPTATATFDFSGIKEPETYESLKNKAQVKYVTAKKDNNPKALEEAAVDLAVFTAMESKVPTAQANWAEKKAQLATISVKGGAEGKAAQAELDKMVGVEAREAAQKHIKPAGEGEGKVPALGTLNSFVKDAGSRAVDMVHGKQLGKQLSRTQMPDGTMSLQYIGDNPEFAAQVDATRRTAALKALSLYPANNRDVQSILATYDSVAPAVVPEVAPPAKPTLPVIAPKNAPAAAPATAGPKPSIGQERATALDAIRQGANEKAVKERFKATTGQDL